MTINKEDLEKLVPKRRFKAVHKRMLETLRANLLGRKAGFNEAKDLIHRRIQALIEREGL